MVCTYRYVQLTIILMMSGSIFAAVLTPAEPTRFKTEADISRLVKSGAVGIGFISGVVEQTAAFNIFLSDMARYKNPMSPCIFYGLHWAGTIALAFHMIDKSEKKLAELKSPVESFVPVMTKMGFDRIYTSQELLMFRDSYAQLYKGEPTSSQLDASKVHAAYNDLLQQRVYIQHFWHGALAAALFGPIGGAVGTGALYKLGALDLD